MKTSLSILTVISLTIIVACSTSKKSTTSTASSSNAGAPTNTVSAKTDNAPANKDFTFIKPASGIYAPGEEELAALQPRYSDVTLEKLKTGHYIYTEGACVKCHGASNIYSRSEEQWKPIIDDMARKAFLSDEQKDAVYKYVLAIKAVQSKQGK